MGFGAIMAKKSSILPSFEAHMALGFENEPWRHGHSWPSFRGKLVFSSDHFLVRIYLRRTIVELARKSKMTSGYWSCEHHSELFTFMLTSTQS